MVVMESETCRLEVVCGSTRCGDEVCCVGAPAALGQWNAIFAIPLLTDPSSFPTWAAPKFPLLAIGAEFKFVIRRQGGMVDWESFAGNRCWPPGVGRGGVVRVNYGEPTIKVVEAGSLEKLAPLPGNVLQPKSATSFRRLSTGRFLVHDDMVQTPFGCSSSASTVFSPSPNTSMSYGSGSSNPSHISSIFGDRGRVQDFYDTEGASLGSGNSGTVRVATNRRTSERRAIKTIHKLCVDDLPRFKTEIEIMKIMDHPNVIKLYEHFDDIKYIDLVMELCSGGDLLAHIISTRGDFSETHVAHIMKQVLKGMNYIHLRQVAHRDIKPENCLLRSSELTAENSVKIIDFGLARRCTPGQVMTTSVGTLHYVAPEVLSGAYGQPVDMWSCGVVLFCLLCGRLPFSGASDRQVLIAIRSGRFSFEGESWRVSPEAKQFVCRLLCLSPSERIGTAEALGSDWLTSTLGKQETGSMEPSWGIELMNRLRIYKSQHLLKKATLQIIAWRFLDHERLHTMEETFRQLDVNCDGFISISEIREGLERSGVEDMPRDLQQIVDSLDTEGNGTINYTAFLAATTERRYNVLDDVLKAAFDVFDKNGDGKISEEELRHVLDPCRAVRCCSEPEYAERIAEILRQADYNGDGQIDFQEFVYMMNDASATACDTSTCGSGPKPCVIGGA
mmetsp:Transcript_92096/g.296277  ORF Transcript_92096/g.296277 Transcript_92096/m.296277 type:complete len:674 (-) Transcript_92096:193-2214(-)